MMKPIRGLVATLALYLVAVGAASSQTAKPDSIEDAYPVRPIKVVIPFLAGSSIDVAGRIVAQKLGELLGQPVVVENRAGAAGNLGAAAVAQAAPDGYTLLHTINSLAASPALYPNLGFDPVRDLTPIVGITAYPFILVVNPSSPMKTVRDLVALAKQSPGKLSFGSAGMGSPDHLTQELMNAAAGIKMLHVPFKGGSAVLPEIMAGRIDMTFTGLAGGLPHIRAGKLRALAVSTSTRTRTLPDVPTLAESGFRDFDIPSSSTIYAPAKTPRSIIDKLNREVVKVLATPDVRARFDALGVDPDRIGGTPERLGAALKAEAAQWKKLIEEAGIRPSN
jgi:tripartite-type tricarboxylate transporter receptor subunit TctC